MTDQKLVDFDWNLEFITGSKAVSSVDQPLFHLHMNLADSYAPDNRTNPTVTQSMDIELDRTQLDSLVSQLEASLSSS